MGTEFLLKNRYMHVDFQSAKKEISKCKNCTLECTLEEIAILKLIIEDESIKQNVLVEKNGKSLSTVKRIMVSLQEKGHIRRVNGKRYGKWEVLVDL